jgi:VWFA-related protein
MNSPREQVRRTWARALTGAAALCFVLLCWPGGRAVAGGAPGQTQKEVMVTVKLIQAYVTAKDGKPVTDLTAADFEVTDNGKPVPVTHFENHILGGDDVAPGVPVEGPRLGRKLFLFFDFAFVDPRGSRKAREAALHFIDTAVKPGDEVGVMSYSPMRGLTIHEYLTPDHAKVRGIVDAFGLRAATGRAESLTNFLYADELRHMQDDMTAGQQAGQASDAGTAEGFFANLARAQSGGVVDEGRRQGYVDQARQFAQTFANLARALRYVPGWKNIILFSSGFSRALITGQRGGLSVPSMNASNPDAMMAEMNAYDNAQSNSGVRTEFATALKELKTSNSPIYAIDCSLPLGEMDINNPLAASVGSRELSGKDSLIQLAGETGGKYFSNSMDYRNALATVEDITSAYYVLGYSLPAAWDGAFHRIKVKVTRPGCKVFSQNGYYNPKPFGEYTKFEKLLQMTDLALSDNPQAQLPVEAPMGVMPVMVGGWPHVVAFVGLSKEAAASVIGTRAEVYLLLSDEDKGRTAIKNFRIKLPVDGPKACFPTFMVPLNPGRYSCRIVVQNAETGLGARASASLVIPKAAASSVWLDPPLLLETDTGGLDLGAAPEATLSALFGYDPGKYAPLVGALPSGPQRIHAALRITLGVPEVELEITASDSQAAARSDVAVTVLDVRQTKSLRSYLLELAFGGLKPGLHTLTIVAKDKAGGQGSETTISFSVK